MSAQPGHAKEPTDRDRQRAIVRTLRFRRYLPLAAIVAGLQRKGIVASLATVSRDVALLRKEFAEFAVGFDVLVEVGVRAARPRRVYDRGMRAAEQATNDGDRARLLRESTRAINSEVLLLQAVGLLPRDLAVPRVADAPIEKIPSGWELQRLFEETVVDPTELVSEAEGLVVRRSGGSRSCRARRARQAPAELRTS